MLLEVATVNGEVLLNYANDDGIVILSHPMLPDEGEAVDQRFGRRGPLPGY